VNALFGPDDDEVIEAHTDTDLYTYFEKGHDNGDLETKVAEPDRREP